MSKSPTAERLRAAIARAVPPGSRFGGFFHRAEPPTWAPDALVLVAGGGGKGHRTRAEVIERLLGVPMTIADAVLPTAELVIVDTFPLGVHHAIAPAVLLAVPMRVLVQRYVRPGAYEDYDALVHVYHARIAPYPYGACEWQDCDADVDHVGVLTRDVRLAGGPPSDVVGIGDRRLLGCAIGRALPADMPFVDGPFDVLPPARAYVGVGAGYNLVYELAALGVHAAHVPFERRYDNQFLRVERRGSGLHRASDVARFLEAAP